MFIPLSNSVYFAVRCFVYLQCKNYGDCVDSVRRKKGDIFGVAFMVAVIDDT